MLNRLDSQARAYLFAGMTVLLWSTIASAFKISLRYLDNFQLLFVSVITATLCLLAILLSQNRLQTIRKLAFRDHVRLLLLGLLNPFLYYLVLFEAYDLLPAQVAQSLNYTWAITLMFLSIPILGHRVSRHDIAATAICYSGVLLICLGGSRFPEGNLSVVGIALALGSTIIWALYWLYKTRDRIDPLLGLFLSFLFSLPFVSLACLLFSDFSTFNVPGILGGVYIGLFEMGISFALWLTALRLTRAAAKISTLIFIAPFLSLFIIRYVVGETIAATTVVGLGVIVAGLLLQRRDGKTPVADT